MLATFDDLVEWTRHAKLVSPPRALKSAAQRSAAWRASAAARASPARSAGQVLRRLAAVTPRSPAQRVSRRCPAKAAPRDPWERVRLDLGPAERDRFDSLLWPSSWLPPSCWHPTSVADSRMGEGCRWRFLDTVAITAALVQYAKLREPREARAFTTRDATSVVSGAPQHGCATFRAREMGTRDIPRDRGGGTATPPRSSVMISKSATLLSQPCGSGSKIR
jgi:hypothetical protein